MKRLVMYLVLMLVGGPALVVATPTAPYQKTAVNEAVASNHRAPAPVVSPVVPASVVPPAAPQPQHGGSIVSTLLFSLIVAVVVVGLGLWWINYIERKSVMRFGGHF